MRSAPALVCVFFLALAGCASTRAPRPGLHVKWLESRNGETGNVVSIRYFGRPGTSADQAFGEVLGKACEIGRERGRYYLWLNEATSNGSVVDVETRGAQTVYVPVPTPGMPDVAVTTPAEYSQREIGSALLVVTFVEESTVRALNTEGYSQVYLDARTCAVIPT